MKLYLFSELFLLSLKFLDFLLGGIKLLQSNFVLASDLAEIILVFLNLPLSFNLLLFQIFVKSILKHKLQLSGNPSWIIKFKAYRNHVL